MKSLSHRSTGPALPLRDLHRVSQMAVAEERNRLAREIHDTLAQAFTSIIFQADNLESALGAGEIQVKDALGRIQELARSGLDEARRAVRALRPKELEGRTLPEALERAARNLSGDLGFTCEFHQLGQPKALPPEVEDELFRIAREAMHNAVKHAQTGQVAVHLHYQKGQVVLTVQDHGVGLVTKRVPARQGHGLAIMRERAQRIGSELMVESPATGGVAIRVLVPTVTATQSRGNPMQLPAGEPRAATRFRLASHEV